MNWYYSVEGLAKGPVNEQTLEDLAREGQVAKDTLVWKVEMEEWVALQKAKPDLLEKLRKEKAAPLSLQKGTAPVQVKSEPRPPDSQHSSSPQDKPGLFGRWFNRDKN